MKAVIIGGVSLLALSGCAVNTYPNFEECTDVVYYAPEVPGYATLGAIAGGLGLAMLSDGDAFISILGAGVGAATGANLAGGLHRHEVCAAESMSDVVVPDPVYTKSEYFYEK